MEKGIQISLKQFVKIFKVDKVGERMSATVKKSWRGKKMQAIKEL